MIYLREFKVGICIIHLNLILTITGGRNCLTASTKILMMKVTMMERFKMFIITLISLLPNKARCQMFQVGIKKRIRVESRRVFSK
jgi:hypothetical protein